MILKGISNCPFDGVSLDFAWLDEFSLSARGRYRIALFIILWKLDTEISVNLEVNNNEDSVIVLNLILLYLVSNFSCSQQISTHKHVSNTFSSSLYFFTTVFYAVSFLFNSAKYPVLNTPFLYNLVNENISELN